MSHFAATTWERLYDCVDSERIEKYSKLSTEEFSAVAEREAPRLSNTFTGNVIVDCLAGYTCLRIPDVSEKNLETDDRTLFADAAGGNYALSEAGLAQIRRVYPEFENIPFEKIGKSHVSGLKTSL